MLLNFRLAAAPRKGLSESVPSESMLVIYSKMPEDVAARPDLSGALYATYRRSADNSPSEQIARPAWKDTIRLPRAAGCRQERVSAVLNSSRALRSGRTSARQVLRAGLAGIVANLVVDLRLLQENFRSIVILGRPRGEHMTCAWALACDQSVSFYLVRIK